MLILNPRETFLKQPVKNGEVVFAPHLSASAHDVNVGLSVARCAAICCGYSLPPVSGFNTFVLVADSDQIRTRQPAGAFQWFKRDAH
jgi:hypothetical protein